jgi:hypothetical protein
MKIIILAGGSGDRLFPLSRDSYTKILGLEFVRILACILIFLNHTSHWLIGYKVFDYDARGVELRFSSSEMTAQYLTVFRRE